MAVFEIVEGKPGQGKSLYHARLIRKLIKRNKKWFDKSGICRVVYSNIKLSPEFEKKCLYKGKNFLKYWDTVHQITELRDVDLLWDEIATELDSRNYANLTEDLKRFLSQYRKRGVDIYANTQDFSMIDARARLMITRVASLTKLVGSRDPSTTRPPIKYVWGLVIVREVENIMAEDPHNKKYSLIPSFFFIDREDVELYDTTQDIPASPPVPRKRYARDVLYYGGHKDGERTTEYTK
jgi:hypothetical protein